MLRRAHAQLAPPLHAAALRRGAPDPAELAPPAIIDFDTLYHEHADLIYALCLRMTGEPAHASDLMQEVFFRAWQRLDTFRQESRPGTWLYRVAVNVCLNWACSERRHREGKVEIEDFDLLAFSGRDTPELRLDLEAAIASLPTKARAIFVLHDVEGFRQAEIAALSGIAVGTVKAQLHRARQLLQRRINR